MQMVECVALVVLVVLCGLFGPVLSPPLTVTVGFLHYIIFLTTQESTSSPSLFWLLFWVEDHYLLQFINFKFSVISLSVSAKFNLQHH